MPPIFFPTPADFRAWLEVHHATASELIVGFYRKSSGKPSVTWPEAVDQALCFGWIDGIRRRIDDESYSNRFTPRRRGSNWSAVNLKKIEKLMRLGLMHPAGIKAFEERVPAKSGVYSYEQRKEAKLGDAQVAQFRASPGAWEFFRSQPRWYRTAATYWVVSAKREETRQKRLARLIEDSADRRTVPPLTRPTGSQ